MRFVSSIKHAGKQFFRNKSRAVTLMFGIIISITLISGILYATDSLTTYSVETNLKQTPFDITVDSNTSLATVENGWNTLETGSSGFNANYLNVMYATSTGVFVSTPSSISGRNTNTLLDTQRGAVVTLNTTSPPSQSASFNYTSVLAANASLWNYLNQTGIVNLDQFNPSNLNDGEVLIDNITATNEGISVGDGVNVYTFWSDNSTLEVSNLTVVGIIQVLDTTNLFNAFYPDNLINGSTTNLITPPGGGGNFGRTITVSNGFVSRITESITTDSCFIFANLDFGRQIIVNASSSDPTSMLSTLQYRYIFQLNHAALPIFDLSQLSTTMAYIENQLQQATGITETLTDYITTAIASIQSDLTFFEITSLVVSVPAVVLGVYLTMVLYNLALEQRRREFGILKSRGASSKDVAKIYLLEAGFIATVGGLVGSFLGVGISYGLISQILGSAFQAFLAIAPITINWVYVLAAIGFALALTLIASARPIKTYSQLTVVENVTYYNEALATKQKKSRVEWVALVLGLLPIILLLVTDLLSTTSSPTFSSGGFGGGRSFSGGIGIAGLGSALYSTLNEIGSALTWFSPVLLTYALVKIIIGKSPERFAKISRKISSIFSKKTSYMVSTNITRNPNRSSQVVTIIAITICFGLMAQIIQQSQAQFETNQVYLAVGADIRVTGTNTGYALQSQIQAISSDILNISTVSTIQGTLSSTTTAPMQVVGLNVASLPYTVDLQSQYFYGQDPNATLTALAAKTDGALLSETLATSLGLSVGSTFTIAFTNSSATMTLSAAVVGYMQLLPGVSSSTTGTTQGEIFMNYAYLNDTVLPNLASVSYVYLIKIAPNATHTPAQLEAMIKTSVGTQISSITTLADELAALNARTTVYQNVITLMSFQFPFLLVIATFGIMMVTILSLVEKRREMALIRVKGVTEKQQIRVQLAEGFVLILIGLVVGAGLGFPLAYLANIQLDTLDTRSTTLNLARPYVVPIGATALILVLVPILFLLIILLTSYLENRKSRIGPITDILRSY